MRRRKAGPVAPATAVRRGGVALLAAIVATVPARPMAANPHPTAASADARRAERLGIGSAAEIRRMVREGPTPAQIAAAGGSRRPDTLAFPIPGSRIGRGHGSGDNGYHKALDVIGREGTPIIAAERGIVVYAGDELRGYGNLVAILHPGGWITYYAHCSGMPVRPGAKVSRGQRIALVGNTGISRGPHLHFVLWIGGRQVDPYPFLHPAPPPPASGPPPHRGHRVRRGETWAGIARQHELSESALREANGMGERDRLVPGWRILIPARMAAGELPPPDSWEMPDGGTYVVQAGDTVWEIARRFDIPRADLARWNDLADPSRIRVGMTLVLLGEETAPDDVEEAPDGPQETPPMGVVVRGGPGGGEELGAEQSPGMAEAALAAPCVWDLTRGRAVPPDERIRQVYVVRTGETLGSIARAVGIPVRDLLLANDLPDPDRLIPGRRLVIPDVGGGPSGERVSADGQAAAADLAGTYRVRRGDSVWSVARKFGTSVRRVLDLNPDIDPAGRIRPGRILRVPVER